MNKKLFFQAIFAFVFLINVTTNAQDRVLFGMVTTFDSIPLNGAIIKVQSTKQTVLSDSLGNFKVMCNSEDKLTVIAKGFYTQKIKLRTNVKFAAVNLKMKPGTKSQEYAIGYGYISDKDKSTAVNSLNTEGAKYAQYNDIYDLIEGNFAGVQVVGNEIRIRGVNSINSSSAALIVIDGVISDESMLSTIPTIEVKSINIIKDGTSAIYGSRGTNGVVLIETKKGGDK